MKFLRTIIAVAPLVLLSAQASAADTAAPAPATAAVPMTDGEIKKVDIDAKKITIKHAEIKNLDMPPMTMVFQVKDAALLEKVKTGDKVKFTAEKAKSGYAVTAMEVAK